MTEVKIRRKSGKIVSVECLGHCDYGCEGEDIVCAALSSVVQTAALGLMQVAGIQIAFKAESGELYMELPKDLSESARHDADVILETMLAGIADLYEGYSDYIELEVK